MELRSLGGYTAVGLWCWCFRWLRSSRWLNWKLSNCKQESMNARLYSLKPLQGVQQVQAPRVPPYATGIVIHVVWRTGVMALTRTKHRELQATETSLLLQFCCDCLPVRWRRTLLHRTTCEQRCCRLQHLPCNLSANLCRKAPYIAPQQ